MEIVIRVKNRSNNLNREKQKLIIFANPKRGKITHKEKEKPTTRNTPDKRGQLYQLVRPPSQKNALHRPSCGL